ncbi:hypothetical protein SAMN05421671_3194 [Pimelobacter simplex]|nr:hypothetical protein NSI01_17910 [Pimelobacter simplex]SFM73016.1 hypothetical protein SAMN05421671_3194 [Pimelobacter simplex]
MLGAARSECPASNGVAMNLSATYGDRAALQREIRGPQWFASEETTGGRDEHTGLEVEVDATGWPVRVGALTAVAPELRDAAGLRGALERAIGGAVLGHLARNAERRRLSPADLERGRELVEGRRRLVPPPYYRAAPLVAPDGPVQPRSAWRDDRLDRTVTGTSRDGELRIELGYVDGLRRLEADAQFLATAPADLLRHALNEAFTDAQEGGRR